MSCAPTRRGCGAGAEGPPSLLGVTHSALEQVYPLDPASYQATCREWAVADGQLRRWLALGELLGGRPGWHFELANLESGPGIMWGFGIRRAARLVVTVPDSYLLYDSDADEAGRHLDCEHPFATVPELLAWLEAHEAEHEGLTPLQKELLPLVLANNLSEWRGEGHPSA